MLILIDKPKVMTSHDVVDRIRKITGIKKVGHGGTLDPNASGLLIIGITREGTKKLGEISKNKDKTYVAELILGEERDTHDVEGEVIQQGSINKIQHERLISVINQFQGEQSQLPPKFSAIKVNGKKAYELARKGRKVDLDPRKITIHNIQLINFDFPKLELRIKASSGTYIRSLARDIGRELGTYAYLNELRRVEIGKYEIAEAVKLQNLTSDNWKSHIVRSR